MRLFLGGFGFVGGLRGRCFVDFKKGGWVFLEWNRLCWGWG